MSIKNKLDLLDANDKRFLMYAFENQLSQYIDLPGGKFIGVNVNRIKHLVIEEEAGVWAYGTVKGKGDETG